MPRAARILPEEGLFHVLTRGNNRAKVFHEANDFEAYLKILTVVQRRHPFRLYHYCLMPNHVHLLLETVPGQSLSLIMKKINLTYAVHYKERYDHVGHLWQDRYKSLLIEKETYLLACAAYIELNPVKAGIVSDPASYPYSSFSCYTTAARASFLTPNPFYSSFGEEEKTRRMNYRSWVLARVDDYENYEKEAEGQLALGSPGFIRVLEDISHRKIRRRPRGRPKLQEK